jgi:hypothetical protein
MVAGEQGNCTLSAKLPEVASRITSENPRYAKNLQIGCRFPATPFD